MNFGEIWNKIKKNWVISAIVTGLIGLVMLLFPGNVLLSACYCIGGLSIAMGVIKVVRYFKKEHHYPYIFQSDLVLGLFTVGLGLFMVTSPSVFMTLVPQLFGMLLIGCGVGNILRSVDAKNAGFAQWGVLLGMAILSIIAGLVIMSNPFGTSEVLVLVTGGALVCESITDILTTLFINAKLKAIQRDAKARQ
ncbi:MAG: DUF308 domain-containing protein [Clostridia bacterium]|nr:DUF308 domain-containing protein [Clostridia bacterium]